MTNDIGDMVLDKNDRVFIIVDVKPLKDNCYLFHLHNLSNNSSETWFEPWAQELAPSYWQTLA